MRVLLYGNQDNICYRLGKWLREKNIDATLYYQTNYVDDRSKPEWEDPALKDNYPEWIKPFRGHMHNWVMPKRKTVKASKDCDVIVTSGSYIVGALSLKKPVVLCTTGGDMTVIPFDASSLRAEIFSYIYRRRIGMVSRVITVQEPAHWAGKLLGLRDDQVISYPLPIDVDAISGLVNTDLLRELNNRYSSYDLVFFNPTRKNLKPSKIDYKGGEKVLRAFKRLRESMPSLKTKLISIVSGNDVLTYRKMVEDMGLNDHCDLINHLPLPELHAYMSIQNVVVADQFGIVGRIVLAGIARETISLGTPLITATETDSARFIETYAPECPLLKAFTEDDILTAMKEVADYSAEKRKEIGEKSKDWMRKHMHWENRIEEFIQILKDVVEEKNAN